MFFSLLRDSIQNVVSFNSAGDAVLNLFVPLGWETFCSNATMHSSDVLHSQRKLAWFAVYSPLRLCPSHVIKNTCCLWYPQIHDNSSGRSLLLVCGGRPCRTENVSSWRQGQVIGRLHDFGPWGSSQEGARCLQNKESGARGSSDLGQAGTCLGGSFSGVGLVNLRGAFRDRRQESLNSVRRPPPSKEGWTWGWGLPEWSRLHPQWMRAVERIGGLCPQ